MVRRRGGTGSKEEKWLAEWEKEGRKETGKFQTHVVGIREDFVAWCSGGVS